MFWFFFFSKEEALLSRMYFWKIATLLKTGALWYWMVYCCIQLFEMCDAGLFVFFKMCNWSAWIILTQTERGWGQVSFPDRSIPAQYSRRLFWLMLFKQCTPSRTDMYISNISCYCSLCEYGWLAPPMYQLTRKIATWQVCVFKMWYVY